MARRLPPLNALRAFEAGARHLSFTKAAEELFVTQAAVSHQVKLLEQDLGVALFRRMTRKLALTAEGRRLFGPAGEALDSLAEAAEALRAGAGGGTLTLSLTPTFGVQWLAQRIGRFWSAHPEIELRLQHSIHLVDFARDEVDAAVRWGGGAWPGLAAVYLMRAGLTPVCSPALCQGPPALKVPDDLRHHTLLHERDYVEWAQWLALAGAREVEARRGPIIDDSTVVLQAVIDGQGVALVSDSIIRGDLESGRLVKPFDVDLDTDNAYYLVAPPRAFERPNVQAFRDFLLAELAAENNASTSV
ncbi:MAG: transcriptional regulator GcvA [Alphaproteobacteria bacterium]